MVRRSRKLNTFTLDERLYDKFMSDETETVLVVENPNKQVAIFLKCEVVELWEAGIRTVGFNNVPVRTMPMDAA